jgi:putative DNA primase/helicase
VTTHTDLLDTAVRWFAAGAAVLPLTPDGSKAPAVRWKDYQQTAPGIDAILGWFGSERYDGLGVLTGAVSGNLELLEFEGRAVDAGLLATLDQHADDNGMAGLIEKLLAGYCERTPSGGIHLLYRVTGGDVGRNTKLARTADRHVLAETRGEGGFVVVAPSFGRSHPSGLPWTMISGSIEQVPVVTADERDQLWALVQLLDESTDLPAEPYEQATGVFGSTPGTRPGDDYAAKVTWGDILTPLGWTRKFRMGNGYAWQRPGKDTAGISATTGQAKDGVDRLYVFSSSTEFEPERPYNKFSAYALIHHHGDYAAAATQLARDGYGTPATQPILQISPPVPPITAPPGPSPRHLTVVDGSNALAPDPDPLPVAHTLAQSEDGHSQALIAEHGEVIRYCPERGRWLHWDGRVWRWQEPGGGYVKELAKDVARAYPDDGTWRTHRKRSLSNGGLSACLALTETDRRIVVSIDDLDAHPWELNTPGGIIDLRTGLVHPSDPARLHTKSTSVAPDMTADQSAWLAFLDDTFNADREMTSWLRRLFGYACVGEVREAILPLFFGLGANGKTTLLEAVSGVLGDYATQAPQGFLVQGPPQHPAEIAELAGARLVIASETNEDQKFDEAKVKQLTGGDRLRARFMRQDWFGFAPSHTLILMTNHRPEVRSGGHGFWRRVREVPFLHAVPEDKKVEKYHERLIVDHGPAIMAWLARGAAEYATSGLRDPEGVRVATSEYQASTDTVARFVEDMCIVGGGDQVRCNSSKVRAAYEQWCAQEGENAISAKALTMQLAAKYGIGKARDMRQRFLTNVTLVGDDDE